MGRPDRLVWKIPKSAVSQKGFGQSEPRRTATSASTARAPRKLRSAANVNGSEYFTPIFIATQL